MIDIVGMASGAAAAAVDDDASGSSPSGDSSDDDIENMRQAERRITATARVATTATATVAAGDDGVGDGDEEDASLIAASLVEEAISSAISTHDAEVLAAGEADAGECAALALPIAPSDVKAVGARRARQAATARSGAARGWSAAGEGSRNSPATASAATPLMPPQHAAWMAAPGHAQSAICVTAAKPYIEISTLIFA